MVMPESLNGRENKKFRDAGDGNSKVAVTIEDGLLGGVTYDDFTVTYPNTTQEIYTYFLSTVQVAQIEISYTSSDKTSLLRGRRL